MIESYCPICKEPVKHDTICEICDMILSLAKYNSQLLRRAANYLETKG
jgi:hypothetical protein